MIIQIRGTSGSGKSTAMRKVMDSLGGWEPRLEDGRKRPLYYRRGSIAILGHYDSPCGGCDTIGSAVAIYALINVLLESKTVKIETVLCEGLLLSEDVKWSSQLPDLKVLFLTTPLDRCLSQIEGRRKEAGNEKPLNPSNTSNRVGVIERARMKLLNLGIDCRRCSADQAPGIILKLLKEWRIK